MNKDLGLTSWGFWGPGFSNNPVTHVFICADDNASKNSRNNANPKPWVLPPLSNTWIIIKIWLYIALNRTHSIDCYWGGGQYPT